MEKYRPNTLDDVVGNTETIERLKIIARDGNCPHIIISVSLWYLKCCVRVLNVGNEGYAWYRKDDEYTLSGAPNARRRV